MKLIHTPVKKYKYQDHEYLVKREDVCGKYPLPPFSKIRGLLPVITRLKKQGIKYVVYVESAISMAGIGVAVICEKLKMQAIIFDPQYKNETPKTLLYHRKEWKKHNATIIPYAAGMVKVGWYIARKHMANNYPDNSWELLPLGIPFQETVKASTKEMKFTLEHMWEPPKTLVIPIGSGTVASGVICACDSNIKIYGILCRSGNISRKLASIMKKGNWTVKGLINRRKVKLIDLGYQYTQPEDVYSPFPCNRFYDKKAYKWMIDNIHALDKPVVFWNIGSEIKS